MCVCFFFFLRLNFSFWGTGTSRTQQCSMIQVLNVLDSFIFLLKTPGYGAEVVLLHVLLLWFVLTPAVEEPTRWSVQILLVLLNIIFIIILEKNFKNPLQSSQVTFIYFLNLKITSKLSKASEDLLNQPPADSHSSWKTRNNRRNPRGAIKAGDAPLGERRRW